MYNYTIRPKINVWFLSSESFIFQKYFFSVECFFIFQQTNCSAIKVCLNSKLLTNGAVTLQRFSQRVPSVLMFTQHARNTLATSLTRYRHMPSTLEHVRTR